MGLVGSKLTLVTEHARWVLPGWRRPGEDAHVETAGGRREADENEELGPETAQNWD